MKFGFEHGNKRGWIGLVAAVLALTGCAGADFVRMESSALVLGKTSQQEILQRMGEPFRTGAMEKNGKTMQAVSYAYASAGGEALYAGVTPARSQGFYFLDGTLVGAEFSSSFKVDGTDFDETRLARIEKGKSTKADVIRLLGAAGGGYMTPMTNNPDDSALVYLYSQTKGSAFNLRFYVKTLIVSYDQSGVVTDVQYSAQGNKD
jgi:hypothetical protein